MKVKKYAKNTEVSLAPTILFRIQPWPLIILRVVSGRDFKTINDSMILKSVVQVSRLFILWLTHDPKLLPQIWPSENLCLKLSNSPRIFPQNKTSWSYCVSHHATWTVGDRGTFFITLVISKHDAMIWNAFLGLPVVSIIWWHTSGKSCFLNKQTSGVEFIQDTRRIHQSWSFFIFTCIKTLSSSHFNCFFWKYHQSDYDSMPTVGIDSKQTYLPLQVPWMLI